MEIESLKEAFLSTVSTVDLNIRPLLIGRMGYYNALYVMHVAEFFQSL